MSSPVAEQLLGATRPRLESWTRGDSSAGPIVVEMSGAAGFPLDDHQVYVLEVGLQETGGRWTNRTVVDIEPRQNGKSAVARALMAGSVTVLGERRCTYSTQNLGSTTMEMIDELEEMLSSPAFGRKLRRREKSTGREALVMTNGAKIRFLSRSRGSGRGPSVDRVIWDEAYSLKPEHVAAALPGTSAKSMTGNPQTWWLSSAPLEDSTELHRMRAAGIAGAHGLAFLEWSADPDADRTDPRTWAQANPALGRRISVDHVQHELDTMDPASFDRERLGIVPDDDSTGLPLHLWDGLTDAASKAGQRVAFALDGAPEASSFAIAVAGRRADGNVHVETVEHLPGTAWVLERAVEVIGRRRASISIDPNSTAGQFIAPLRARGVEVVEVSRPELARACASFVTGVKDAQVRHLGQASLTRSVVAARRKSVGSDGWIWSRTTSTVDICPLVAATMAWWQIAGTAPRRPRNFSL